MKQPALQIKLKLPQLPLKRWSLPLATSLVIIILLVVGLKLGNRVQTNSTATQQPAPVVENPNIVPLPSPVLRSNHSIEAVLKTNQPRRDYQDGQLSLKQVGQMLWAAQGVTQSWGGRTVDSEKSVYPLKVYLLANRVEKLETGLYQYVPGDRLPAHQLLPFKLGDLNNTLYTIVNQTPLQSPPAVMVITGDMDKEAEAYGGIHHDEQVYLEAGAAAQNMYLQAESLGLGLAAIPNFDQTNIRRLFSIPANETLIYLIPFGIPKE